MRYRIDEQGSAIERARGYMIAMHSQTVQQNPKGVQAAALAAIAAWLEVIAEEINRHGKATLGPR